MLYGVGFFLLFLQLEFNEKIDELGAIFQASCMEWRVEWDCVIKAYSWNEYLYVLPVKYLKRRYDHSETVLLLEFGKGSRLEY